MEKFTVLFQKASLTVLSVNFGKTERMLLITSNPERIRIVLWTFRAHFQMSGNRNVNDLLRIHEKKLDLLCFARQRLGCFHTFFKYSFLDDTFLQNGEHFNTMRKAASFNKPHECLDKMSRNAKKRLPPKDIKLNSWHWCRNKHQFKREICGDSRERLDENKNWTWAFDNFWPFAPWQW